MKDSKIKIFKEMCFDVGSHYLKIINIDNNSLTIGFSPISNLRQIIEFTCYFENKDKIIFGKNPKKTELNNIITFQKENNLENEHGYFTKNKQNSEIELTVLGNIWFKLDKFNSSKFPFWRLEQNMEIKLSKNHIFIVKFPGCSRPQCNKPKNSIYLNCYHSIYCFECSIKQFQKEKKCKKCQKNIESIEIIINN